MTKKNFLNTINDCRITVLGDFILDEYIWGTSNRISPEAPVPILKMSGSEIRLGGAANVVNNVHKLGAIPIPISVVGQMQGWKLVVEIEKLGIQSNQIIQSDTYKNSHKIRVVAGAQQMIRLDNDSDVYIDSDTETQLIENIEYSLKNSQALVISDYKKGVLTPRVIKKAISLANGLNIPIIIDPKGKDYSPYRNASVLTPNEAELELATGIQVKSEDFETVQIAAMVLIKKLNLDALVLTQSEDGMTIFNKNGTFRRIGSLALEVYDVTGAGDTVAASLACGMATGESVEESAQIASQAAAIVVSKVGTSTCSIQELMSDFPKVKEEFELLAELDKARKQGKSIVFTNGCFDLLHSGHVKLLQKASTYGDILVVGINSDESVRELKGPERPMIDEVERAHLLGALSCVDFVSIFHSITPREIISKIKPDVLVKGQDYEDQDIIGSEDAGKVILIDLVKGKSTTNIIEKIKDATS